MKAPSVAIVIVTYNRLTMLQNTLHACLTQGIEAQIYLVNNASTDGTQEYLDDFAQKHSQVTVTHMPTNTGGAGGFAQGMAQAFEAGHEWLWLMDDDVMPTPDGLTTLLQHAKSIGRPCCLYPAKRCADGRLFDFEYKISRKTLRRWRVSSLPALGADALVPSNSGNFEGALVHHAVIEKIGLPDSRFFICWDDAFWGLKAGEHFDCYYLNHVCMVKQLDKERLHLGKRALLSSSLFSRFHFLRNYWEVMRYLRDGKSLSVLAYGRYAWEFLRAAALTALLERNPGGTGKLWRALRQGMTGHFQPWEAA